MLQHSLRSAQFLQDLILKKLQQSMQGSTIFPLKLDCTCSYTIIEVRQLKKNCTVPSKSSGNCVSKMVVFRQRMTPQERLRTLGMTQAGLSHW